MRVVYDLAWDHWQPKFAEADSKEEKERAERLASRRAVETLYRVSADGQPLLLDEHV